MHHQEGCGVIEQCDTYPESSRTGRFVQCFFSAEVEMASVPESIHEQSNGLHLVNWANKLLKINFKDVQQFGSGSLPA